MYYGEARFSRKNQAARFAGMVFEDYALHSDLAVAICDLREDIRFKEADIDYMYQSQDNQWHYCKVIEDMQADKTGNLIYDKHRGNKGGHCERTKADVIFYYIKPSNSAYLIGAKLLRKFANATYEMGEIDRGGKGCYIPIANLVSKNIARKLF